MTVVTWGSHGSGDLSFDVKRQLHNVKEIQASDSAFAALCGDGRVVAWGMPDAGGDCRKVEDELVQRSTGCCLKTCFCSNSNGWDSCRLG